MNILLTLGALVLGLAAGAAGAHIAEAMMARRAWQAPYCPYCQTPSRPAQWSALLALLTGRWRCGSCSKPARWPRLAGELFLAAVWVALAARYGLSLRTVYAALTAVPLMMVLVTDLEAKLIPNRIMLPAIGALLVLGLLYGPAVPGAVARGWWAPLAGGLLGFTVFWLLGVVGVALLGEGALGAGDVKLAAYVGCVVGFPLVVEALLLTFLLGGVGAALVLLARRDSLRGGLRIAIPYGPFLVLGAAITLIWGMELLRWFLY